MRQRFTHVLAPCPTKTVPDTSYHRMMDDTFNIAQSVGRDAIDVITTTIYQLQQNMKVSVNNRLKYVAPNTSCMKVILSIKF